MKEELKMLEALLKTLPENKKEELKRTYIKIISQVQPEGPLKLP